MLLILIFASKDLVCLGRVWSQRYEENARTTLPGRVSMIPLVDWSRCPLSTSCRTRCRLPRRRPQWCHQKLESIFFALLSDHRRRTSYQSKESQANHTPQERKGGSVWIPTRTVECRHHISWVFSPQTRFFECRWFACGSIGCPDPMAWSHQRRSHRSYPKSYESWGGSRDRGKLRIRNFE